MPPLVYHENICKMLPCINVADIVQMPVSQGPDVPMKHQRPSNYCQIASAKPVYRGKYWHIRFI